MSAEPHVRIAKPPLIHAFQGPPELRRRAKLHSHLNQRSTLLHGYNRLTGLQTVLTDNANSARNIPLMSCDPSHDLLPESLHDREQSSEAVTHSRERWIATDSTNSRSSLQYNASMSRDNLSSTHTVISDTDGSWTKMPTLLDSTMTNDGDVFQLLNFDPSITSSRAGGSLFSQVRFGSAEQWLSDKYRPSRSMNYPEPVETTYSTEHKSEPSTAFEHGTELRAAYLTAFDEDNASFIEPWSAVPTIPTTWAGTASSGDYLSVPDDTLSTASEVPSVETSCGSEVLYCPFSGCSVEFRGSYRRGNRQRHVRLYHRSTDPKTYPCEAVSCSRTFKRQDARLKHYRKCHPGLGLTDPVPRAVPGRSREIKRRTFEAPSARGSSASRYSETFEAFRDQYATGQGGRLDAELDLPLTSSSFPYSQGLPNLFDLDTANDSPSHEHLLEYDNEANAGSSNRPICAYCGATFQRQNDLKRHKLMHEGSGPTFYCEFPDCDRNTRGFPRKDKMMEHMRKYHKATVSTSGDGSLHIAVHETAEETTKQSRWPCSFCELVFQRESQLNQHHARKHERRHKCNECDTAFNLKADLDRHKRTVHKASYECVMRCPIEGCVVEFARKDNLVRHLRRVHGQDDVEIALDDVIQLPRLAMSEKGTSTRGPSPDMDIG